MSSLVTDAIKGDIRGREIAQRTSLYALYAGDTPSCAQVCLWFCAQRSILVIGELYGVSEIEPRLTTFTHCAIFSHYQLFKIFSKEIKIMLHLET